jgi:hypothetical protein
MSSPGRLRRWSPTQTRLVSSRNCGDSVTCFRRRRCRLCRRRLTSADRWKKNRPKSSCLRDSGGGLRSMMGGTWQCANRALLTPGEIVISDERVPGPSASPRRRSSPSSSRRSPTRRPSSASQKTRPPGVRRMLRRAVRLAADPEAPAAAPPIQATTTSSRSPVPASVTYRTNDEIPRISRLVCSCGNGASRMYPAGGRRKLPPAPVDPRNGRGETPALAGNPRLSPLNPLAPRPACHAGGRGFESRRSRLSNYLQNRIFRCLSRRDSLVSGADVCCPNPLA